MTQPGMDPLVALLTVIAQSEPQPWYPRAYTESRGMPSGALDSPLEQLRMLGLIELTEWVANLGQGYRLTTAGKKVLYNPGLQARLASGTLQPATPEPEASPEGDWRNPNRGADAFERGEVIRRGLTSNTRPVVTVTLIFLNVAVFLYGLALAVQHGIPLSDALMGDSTIVRESGAISGSLLARGEWWRLVTAFFVHIGIVHLAFNMYALWVLGPISEKMWGRWRFLALYIIAGLCGNCVVALTDARSTAGASGAIWGLMTGFLVWVWINRSALPPQLASGWLRQVGFFLILNVGITIFFRQHISVAGHFGGGAFGVVGALLLNVQRFAGGIKRSAATLALVALPVLAVGAVVVLPKGKGLGLFIPPPLEEVIDQGLDAYNNAGRAYEKSVAPLLKKPAGERNEVEVAEARKSLSATVMELAAMADALRRAGPGQTDALEAQRATLAAALQAKAERYAMVDQKLAQGPEWTAEEQKALDRLKILEDETFAKCQAALKE